MAILIGFSVVCGIAVLLSLLSGKTLYLGLFGRNYIVRRRWEARGYWSMVAQYAVISAAFAAIALWMWIDT